MDKKDIIIVVDIIIIGIFVFVALTSLQGGQICGAIGFFVLALFLSIVLMNQSWGRKRDRKSL